MSRATPRKSRQHHHRHQSGPRILPTSDYESDATPYLEQPPPQLPPQLLSRTNTDLNLAVLQRYLPSITSILSIAANAVVYTFDRDANSWDKANVAGTLFVCDQQPSDQNPAVPRACVVVLNRHGLDNLILDLGQVSVFEPRDQLLSFCLEPSADDDDEDDDEDEDEDDDDDYIARDPEPKKILGLWIHADEDNTHVVNATVIHDRWKLVREAAQQAKLAAHTRGLREESVGPAMQAMGRKLSISDLFGGRQNGAGR